MQHSATAQDLYIEQDSMGHGMAKMCALAQCIIISPADFEVGESPAAGKAHTQHCSILRDTYT